MPQYVNRKRYPNCTRILKISSGLEEVGTGEKRNNNIMLGGRWFPRTSTADFGSLLAPCPRKHMQLLRNAAPTANHSYILGQMSVSPKDIVGYL